VVLGCRAINVAEGRVQTRAEHGFTLIEVLVAVLVLAIGIVGAGAAQVAALETRHGTELMSAGVQLAGSLADRIRANAALAQQPGAASPYHLQYDALTDGAPAAPAVMCFAEAACSAEQLATFDVFEVAHALHRRFPGARIAVCRDEQVWNGQALSWQCAGGPAAPLVVKLGWRGRRAASDASFVPAIAMTVPGAF
jgi:type IV pilus assembly protein PilV